MNINELKNSIEEFDLSQMKLRKIGFVFSGIGSQWKNMASELMQDQPIFAEKISQCDLLWKQYSGWSIADELNKDRGNSRVDDSLIAHPCIFAIQVALADLLHHYGILPDGVVGHSAGEVAAAFVAGIIDLKDAIHIIWNHCNLMQKVIGKGAMAFVALNKDEVDDIVRNNNDQIFVAAINSYKGVVLSGELELLEDVVASMEKKGLFSCMLKIDIPFHSPKIDPFIKEFEKDLFGLKPSYPKIPTYSALKGNMSQDGDFGSQFWALHIRQTVLFADAVNNMIKDGFNTFIEISPHPVLSKSIHECFDEYKNRDYFVIDTLKRDTSCKAGLFRLLITLFKKGFTVNLNKLNSENKKLVEMVVESLEKPDKVPVDEKAPQSINKDFSLSNLKDVSNEKKEKLIENFVCCTVVNIIGHGLTTKIDMNLPLTGLGLDSMMSVELRTRLRDNLNIDVSLVKLLSGFTSKELTQLILDNLNEQQLGDSHSTGKISNDNRIKVRRNVRRGKI